MLENDTQYRQPQYCWHNPSSKTGAARRFFDFFFHMNKMCFSKDNSGRCSKCGKPIMPITETRPLLLAIMEVMFAAFCVGLAFLCAWFAISSYFNLIIVPIIYCSITWLIRRSLYSAFFSYFRWESYNEEDFNLELQWFKVEVRHKAEMFIWAMAFVMGILSAAAIV